MDSINMDSIAWDNCIKLLVDEVSPNDYERWVSLLSFYAVDGKSYTVAPSDYFIKLLKSKSIWQKIEDFCHKNEYQTPLLISQKSAEFETLRITQSDTNTKQQGVTKQTNTSTIQKTDALVGKVTDNLQPKKQVRKKQFEHYTFDNFYEGKSNQLALQVAKSLCESMEEDVLLYNPFFIYGQSGNGKTHLLNAIKNTVNSQTNGNGAFYQQADDFVSRLVSSIRSKSMEKFKAFYRQYDLLLIDDVEFFVAKNSSMEEFFQLMNFFIEENRQIILTSDRLPTEIDLPNRIRSRLASGLSACISQPDFELRVNVLYSIANKIGLNISQDLVYLIATKAKVSIRELCGIIKTLKANMHFSFQNRKITLSDIDNILAPTLRTMNVMVTPENVVKLISEHYGLRPADLTSKVRRRPVVFARHLAMFLMRENTTFSLDEIGKYFSRDHSSVIHAINKVKAEVKKDSSVRQLVDGLTGQLLNNS